MEANLEYADLKEAKVTQEQILEFKSLESATMPGGSTFEEMRLAKSQLFLLYYSATSSHLCALPITYNAEISQTAVHASHYLLQPYAFCADK